MEYNTLNPSVRQETRFFGYIQSRQCQTVEIGQVEAALGLGREQERKLLSKLCRRGLIARVRRGLYLVPPAVPVGGLWSPGAALALSTLMADCDGQYQLCGLNAFNRYGWSEQVPNRYYLYNNRLSGDRRIGPINITLIKVSDSRLGSTASVTTPGGLKFYYPSKARALMDAVYDWSRFGTLPEAYQWIRTEIKKDGAVPADLVDASIRYGNQGTMRRVGTLLEMEGAPNSLLRKLEQKINPSSSLLPWIPSRSRKGKIDKRWGIILNDK